MRTRLAVLMLATLLVCGCDSQKAINMNGIHSDSSQVSGIDSSLELRLTPLSTIQQAFANNQSNLQVMVKGTVIKLLPDDVSGDKHQKMIIRLSNNQTLLVAHNIDIGKRVPATALNHLIYAYGEYEWNSEGGVLHWTHSDPGGTHTNGWIQYNGTIYQ